ncbi:MAG TPA: NADH-quinone oxidoreductase subunit N [Verrucomicrobiae bacterium]|nr:NADH-quinone oxidoreductase subunit N [Verrucomicrobiae bacterium]
MIGQLQFLAPEITLAVVALVVLSVGLLVPRGPRKGMVPLTVLALLVTMAVAGSQFLNNTKGSFLDGMYLADNYATFFKLLFLTAALLVVLSSTQYVQKLPANRGEFYGLIMFATLGMMIMAAAGELITLYIGLELMTISFYVMVAYLSEDGKSGEAGLKYLILGAVSSAVFLYGISFLYGLTGTTVIGDIAAKLGADMGLASIMALVLVMAGFFFKISLVPFHMWAPDIYEGAPTPVTAFLAVASKAAGFAALVRVLMFALKAQAFAATPGLILAVLAGATMIGGNLMAIPQKNFKRMMAYSSIAQAGYIIVGLLASNQAGVKGVLFYSMIYVFANMGAFTVATLVATAQGTDEIKGYAGLARRSPLAAVVMTISLLSLAGIPPLAGFVGKFYLFSAVIDQGYVGLAYVGFVMSMISVYYYLLVTREMFMEEGSELPNIAVSGAPKFTMLLTMVITLAIGIYPSPLAQMAINAATSLFR